MSKDYKLIIGEKEAILTTPDDMELDVNFQNGLIALELQDAISKGITKVTKRIWPCLHCNRNYSAQMTLQRHLEKHDHSNLRIKAHNKLKELSEPKEDPTVTSKEQV